MAVDVRHTTDPAEALACTRSRLHGDPVRHNVMCTLLSGRIQEGVDIRFWWAEEDGAVIGTVFQSPESAPALVGALDDPAVVPLAAAVAAADPPVLGVNGTAADASRFAGAYATATRRPGHPVEAQRLYEIERVVAPAAVAGAPRPAADRDFELLVAYVTGFVTDTGGPVVEEDPQVRARRLLDTGGLHLWEHDGEPVGCAVVSSSEAGVARIGFVYTPPEHRCRGYASALVAELSARVLAAGERCILYTQLANPVSNAIYQQLGYEPVDEIVRYSFAD